VRGATRAKSPLVVTKLLALGRCEARVPAAARVRSGTLLELSGWAAPPPCPLRIAMPRYDGDVVAFARRAAAFSIPDPTTRTPDHVLRRNGARWELVDRNGHASTFTSDDDALRALARLRGSVFVQLPAMPALAAQIAGPAVLEVIDRVEDADYVLVGRFVRHHLEYAWVRPNARRSASPLPLRSAWITNTFDTALVLRDRALRLHKIAAWTFLESPSEWPYRLFLRGPQDGDRVTIGDAYALELHATAPGAPRRHVYVFTIDSYGESTLLFPVSGSVENHFPLAGAPAVIPLNAKIEIAPPAGVDTYFLLSTDEPLANPSILQWDGVRGPMPATATALERLLALTSSTGRGVRVVTPATWSIERVVLESIRPRHKRAASVSLQRAISP